MHPLPGNRQTKQQQEEEDLFEPIPIVDGTSDIFAVEELLEALNEFEETATTPEPIELTPPPQTTDFESIAREFYDQQQGLLQLDQPERAQATPLPDLNYLFQGNEAVDLDDFRAGDFPDDIEEACLLQDIQNLEEVFAEDDDDYKEPIAAVDALSLLDQLGRLNLAVGDEDINSENNQEFSIEGGALQSMPRMQHADGPNGPCPCCIGSDADGSLSGLQEKNPWTNALEALVRDIGGGQQQQKEYVIPPLHLMNYCQPVVSPDPSGYQGWRNEMEKLSCDLQDQEFLARQVRLLQQRPQALEVAAILAERLGLQQSWHRQLSDDEAPQNETRRQSTPPSERSCFGHRGRILGLDISDCGQYLATASEDSTVRIWKIETNQLLKTLSHHSSQYECLRVSWASREWGSLNVWLNRKDDAAHVLASSGADGIVNLYSCHDDDIGTSSEWTCLVSIDHCNMNHVKREKIEVGDFEGREDKEIPQVYSLQCVDRVANLPGEKANDGPGEGYILTSSDDHIHLWELVYQKKAKLSHPSEATSAIDRSWHWREVFSVKFGDFNQAGYGVVVGQVSGTSPLPSTTAGYKNIDNKSSDPAFGGDRNPENLIFVFDASYCSANGLFGVALSDGSMRLLNARGICLSILQLPGVNAHLTSFSWDSSGSRLATCVATGHIITWKVMHDNGTRAWATCSAIMEDRLQDEGKTIFGTCYWGEEGKEQDLLLSWGADGRVCVWDSFSQEEVDAPIGAMVHKSGFPIFAAGIATTGLAIGGGSGDGGFIGIPVYLYSEKKG